MQRRNQTTRPTLPTLGRLPESTQGAGGSCGFSSKGPLVRVVDGSDAVLVQGACPMPNCSEPKNTISLYGRLALRKFVLDFNAATLVDYHHHHHHPCPEGILEPAL